MTIPLEGWRYWTRFADNRFVFVRGKKTGNPTWKSKTDLMFDLQFREFYVIDVWHKGKHHLDGFDGLADHLADLLPPETHAALVSMAMRYVADPDDGDPF